MRQLELALKAAGDPTRTRILKLLERGALCGCQLQAVLELAPSTISEHLATLREAGLVEDRRDGKWIRYGLAERRRNPHARDVLALIDRALERDPTVIADRRRLRDVKLIPLEELCPVPQGRIPIRLHVRRRARRSRA